MITLTGLLTVASVFSSLQLEGPGAEAAWRPRAMKLFYGPSYALSGFSFDTTRKAMWIAESLESRPIEGVELVEPRALTAEEVRAVHKEKYVEAVRTGQPLRLAESQGFRWDPGLWPMVLSSNGGVVDAARAAMKEGVSGSLSSGLHHARNSRGEGFCTFNGLVLAARAALDAGARSVLILDLDAHAGGGTASLIRGDPRIYQVDVSVDDFDRYRPASNGTLDIVKDSKAYLETIRARLQALEQSGRRFDLALYNAGMDPFEKCEVGGLKGVTEEVIAARERMVFEWLGRRGIPVAFVAAGGYTSPELSREKLVELHRRTVEEASKLWHQRRSSPSLVAGTGAFALAYLGKEALFALTDPDRLRRAPRTLASSEFWMSYGTFMGGSVLAEAMLSPAHARLEAWASRASRLGRFGLGALRRSIPLAGGMAAAHIIAGDRSLSGLGLSISSYLLSGLIVDGLVRWSPPGRLLFVASTLRLALTLAAGEIVEGWGKHVVSGVRAKLGAIAAP